MANMPSWMQKKKHTHSHNLNESFCRLPVCVGVGDLDSTFCTSLSFGQLLFFFFFEKRFARFKCKFADIQKNTQKNERNFKYIVYVRTLKVKCRYVKVFS